MLCKYLPSRFLFLGIFIIVLLIPKAFGADVNSLVKIYVDSYQQLCSPNETILCFRVRASENDNWILFAAPIQGFDYKEGISYELLVYETLEGQIVLSEILSQKAVPELQQGNAAQESTGQESTGQESTGQESTGQESMGRENAERENTGSENTATKTKDTDKIARVTNNTNEKNTEEPVEPSSKSSTKVNNQIMSPQSPQQNPVISNAEIPTQVKEEVPATGFKLTGIEWKLEHMTFENKLITPNNKDKYLLHLRADGSLTVKADCYRGVGNYAFNSEHINFTVDYSGAPCEAEDIANVFKERLSTAFSYIVQDHKLHIFDEKNNTTSFIVSEVTETPIEPPTFIESPEEIPIKNDDDLEVKLEPITNKVWLLKSIEKGSQTTKIEGNYGLKLANDNVLQVLTDCNQGTGNYTLVENNLSLDFTLSNKTCNSKTPLANFAKELLDTEVYSILEDKLYIRVATSGNVMVFIQDSNFENDFNKSFEVITIENPAAPPLELKGIEVKKLAIKTQIPTDLARVNKHPFFDYIWAKGPFNYISFQSFVGNNDLEILSLVLAIPVNILTKETSIEAFGNYRWRLYVVETAVINFAIATTVEQNKTYLITVTKMAERGSNLSSVLKAVLASFELLN